MNRFRIVTIAFLLTFLAASCRVNAVRGNGNDITEKRDVAAFTKVEVGGAYTVNIQMGDKESLDITTDENLLKYIRTEVENGVLKIYNKKSISPKRKVVVNITVVKLDGVNSSGANAITITNYSGESLDINGSGASGIKLNGKTNSLNIDISGAVGIDAKDLIAQYVSVDLSGAAGVDVYAGQELKAEISGVGSINYYGNPQIVKKEVSGLGAIHKKD